MGLELFAIVWSLIDWSDFRAVLNREMILKKTPGAPVTHWHKQAEGESHGHWLSCNSAAKREPDTSEVLSQLCGGKQLQNIGGPGLIFDWNEQHQPPLIHHLGKAGSAGQNAPSLSISSKQPFHFALPTANTGIFNLQFISVCQRWKALSN